MIIDVHQKQDVCPERKDIAADKRRLRRTVAAGGISPSNVVCRKQSMPTLKLKTR